MILLYNRDTDLSRGKFIFIFMILEKETAVERTGINVAKKGFNGADVKQRNRGLVLRQVASSRQVSRASITKSIGLTKMAVSNIVSELMDQHYLTETELAVTQGAGRTPVLLDIAEDAPLIAGIYLSRDALSGIVTDLKLNVLFEQTQPLRNETAESLEEKLSVLTDALLSFQPNRLLGIGVSAIGLLDRRQGVLLNPRNFFGIQNFPIVRLLREQSGLPVLLHTDMKAAALAERLYGDYRRHNFIYLGITNGVGSGIISDGKLFHDGNDAAGEIGHLSVDPNGPICSCGRRGCLELYAGMPVVLKRLEEACGVTDLTPKDLEKLSEDWRANAILEEVVEKIATALIDLINLLDADAVLIGHEGSYLPKKYLEMLKDEVNLGIFSAGYKQVEIRLASFGERAPLLGSACCVLDALFAGELEE